MKLKYILFSLLIIVSLLFLYDYTRISGYKIIPSLPAKETPDSLNYIYYKLVNNEQNINWEQLNYSLDYVNSQYDVSDFDIATMLRIIYDYKDKVPPYMLAKMKKSLLKFRYWMDEPGENSMCYWSENHQILFLSAEYLSGQLYPDEVFTSSGLTGRQHMAKAVKKINDWLEMRWKFGFSEFYSNVYYNEDIAGLINLIDYSQDASIVKRAKIVMDLLIYDIASQKSSNMMVSVSGRAYEWNRKGGPRISMNKITGFLWGNSKPVTSHINYGFIASRNYDVPPVLLEIGQDTGNVVIKQCNGINLSRLKEEGYFGSDDRSIMLQWGMEAYSNPEVIRNSLDYMRRNRMFSNEFFKDFKKLDYTFLKIFHLEPVVIKFANPQENGNVIQQANTYTYRTKYFSLYSAQRYCPGNYANQQHVAGMNVGNYFSVFHTHPALPENVKHNSPNYWVGYGRLPDVVQDSTVSLSIYNLPDKKNSHEMDMLHFTHAYFPKGLFDTVIINGKYAFGKKGSVYCALIGNNNFYYKNNSTDDLIQPGDKTFWIIEAGMESQDGSFNNFCSRILINKINFNKDELLLTYNSKGKQYKFKFNGGFTINNSEINTCYGRFDSPYIKSKYKPGFMDFNFRQKYLHLDYYKLKREYN